MYPTPPPPDGDFNAGWDASATNYSPHSFGTPTVRESTGGGVSYNRAENVDGVGQGEYFHMSRNK